MAKKKVQFETFLDGICSFWQLDANRKPVLLLSNVRFQKRVVGVRRNFDAEQAGHTVEMLIRIPRADFVPRGAFVVIKKGDQQQQFKVLQAQPISGTLPECTDLTLEQPDLLATFDENEVGAGGRI